ncbi:MAG: hypothetical protein M3R32_02725 [Chloroflexota bacterium]|nr:hypothetical protein [Chloroflexota bacterium]
MSIDQRIDDQARRYPAFRNDLDAARAPAHAMQSELATAAGIGVQELEARLREAWAEAAEG